jgi:hypothetical protein
MTTHSKYTIPCLCGVTVHSAERETTCPACFRVLVVEWGIKPVDVQGNPKEPPQQQALFPTALDALEPKR